MAATRNQCPPAGRPPTCLEPGVTGICRPRNWSGSSLARPGQAADPLLNKNVICAANEEERRLLQAAGAKNRAVSKAGDVIPAKWPAPQSVPRPRPAVNRSSPLAEIEALLQRLATVLNQDGGG